MYVPYVSRGRTGDGPFGSSALLTSLRAALLCLVLLVTGCGGGSGRGSGESSGQASRAGSVVRPPGAGDPFDYQLGGAYDLPAGVSTVVRDRTAAPAPGAYSICYVNAFQAQPDAVAWWRKHHPDLLLRGADHALVVDEEWDEPLLDVRTADRRRRLAGIVGGWIDGCADRGFDAVEADNLDAYLRSDGLTGRGQAVAFARQLAARAHRAGLALGQKNAAGMTGLRDSIGFDFAVAEECARYDECDAYARAYDDVVLVVEYRKEDFVRGCRQWGKRLSVLLRDRDLEPAGRPGHVVARCQE
ncbi:endo alpha-1,4 polygalactosaminidase [Streptomyces sp. NBC_01317]|uniref:endo alpha-1,4 polygalactosaminidase n=1 Tax=Streptomyces sp. NBC_01317 TaxID=2903822 RepID=UPI002E0D9174|nr:endo alpha-1,4 polygalactosaminidase [Streptomyces sp. NBC_01317]